MTKIHQKARQPTWESLPLLLPQIYCFLHPLHWGYLAFHRSDLGQKQLVFDYSPALCLMVTYQILRREDWCLWTVLEISQNTSEWTRKNHTNCQMTNLLDKHLKKPLVWLRLKQQHSLGSTLSQYIHVYKDSRVFCTKHILCASSMQTIKLTHLNRYHARFWITTTTRFRITDFGRTTRHRER